MVPYSAAVVRQPRRIGREASQGRGGGRWSTHIGRSRSLPGNVQQSTGRRGTALSVNCLVGGSSLRIASSVAAAVSRLNGECPTAISNSTRPKENWSLKIGKRSSRLLRAHVGDEQRRASRRRSLSVYQCVRRFTRQLKSPRLRQPEVHDFYARIPSA